MNMVLILNRNSSNGFSSDYDLSRLILEKTLGVSSGFLYMLRERLDLRLLPGTPLMFGVLDSECCDTSWSFEFIPKHTSKLRRAFISFILSWVTSDAGLLWFEAAAADKPKHFSRGSWCTAVTTVTFVTSSVTPTQNVRVEVSRSATSVNNCGYCYPRHYLDTFFAPVLGAGAELAVQIIFADSASTSAAGLNTVGPSNPTGTKHSADTFYVFQEMDYETLCQIYVPKWNTLNESVLDDHEVCRSVIDQLPSPGLFSHLRRMNYDQLFVKFNVGVARQTCLSAEEAMDLLEFSENNRTFHFLRGIHGCGHADRPVDNHRIYFPESHLIEGGNGGLKGGLDQRVLRPLSPKTLLLSVADVLKQRYVEIANLKAQLSLKEVEATEEIRLHNQVSTIKAAKVARVSELESVKERNSTTSSGLRDQVSGYELFKEQYEVSRLQPTKYVTVLGTFIGLPLTKLESQKDVSIADIMSLLRLEGPSVETMEKIKEGVLSRRLSMDVMVNPISVADYGVLDVEPHYEAPHSLKIVFEMKTWRLHQSILQPVEPAIAAHPFIIQNNNLYSWGHTLLCARLTNIYIILLRYLHSPRLIRFSVKMFLHGNAFWGWVLLFLNGNSCNGFLSVRTHFFLYPPPIEYASFPSSFIPQPMPGDSDLSHLILEKMLGLVQDFCTCYGSV
nr:hypothetical protein [Tanacetum cinerariifolium]